MNTLININMKNVQKIYTKKNIWALCLKIIIPSLFLSLLFGIYIFADQMMLIKLVPNDGINYIKNYFISQNKLDVYEKMIHYVNQYSKDNYYTQIASIDNTDFIIFTVSHIGVFSLVGTSFGYLISTGASILFSKAIAKNNIKEKDNIVSTGIYATLCFSLIISLLLIAIQNVVLTIMMPNANTIQESDIVTNNVGMNLEVAKTYFATYYNGVVENANKYIYFINSTIIFFSLTNLFNYFLRAESKVGVITLIGLSANLLNILLDFIFIYFAKLGLLGGGLATFIGQLMNLSFVFVYLIFLNKKRKTNILFSSLKNSQIQIVLIINFVIIGLSSFLREFSLAIANVVYVPIFVNTIASIDQTALQSYTTIIVSPLYNVFFFSIFGIVDGLRPILSFNFAAEKYRRVKSAYSIGTFLSLIYSFIAIAIMLYLVSNPIIANFLNAPTQYDKNNLLKLSLSMCIQLPFMSLIVGGLALFQTTNRKVMNIITSLFQGVIFFYPILFICSSIAKNTSNIELMVFTGLINIISSSIAIFFITLIYIIFVFNNKKIQTKTITIYKTK